MKILVLVGPQGSGNHLFSKIFSLHEDVHGWKELLEPDGYFIPHIQEPFNEYWKDPKTITTEMMAGKQYAVTSISCPYIQDWVPRIPPLFDFIHAAEAEGITVQPVIIGRDQNILTQQQTRVRGGPSWGTLPQLIRWFEIPPFFVSQELLYLYRRQYVKSLGHWLDFPVADTDPRIDDILKDDANSKYIHAADPCWLDDHVRNINTPPWLRKDDEESR